MCRFTFRFMLIYMLVYLRSVTMNSSWKKVVTVIASLLCVMIVCLAINVSIDKITGNILPLDKNELQQGGSNVQQNNPVVNPNVNVPQQGGNDVQQQNPSVDQPLQNQPTQGQQGGVQQQAPVQNLSLIHI